jgi:hypothetical protein
MLDACVWMLDAGNGNGVVAGDVAVPPLLSSVF